MGKIENFVQKIENFVDKHVNFCAGAFHHLHPFLFIFCLTPSFSVLFIRFHPTPLTSIIFHLISIFY